MKIVHVGIISTAIVIALGIGIVLPPYLPQSKPLVVLLSFDIVNEDNLPQWCSHLSSVLDRQNVKATIFVTGKVASQHPECVSVFSNRNDVGSQTYDYVNLASIGDYTAQLNEIKDGKQVVDTTGNIDSRLFKAPYGVTDENIYSLLNRSGILADFSHTNQYNKYYNGEFIKFNATTYNGTTYSADFFHTLSDDNPVLINFDNSTPVENIDNYISQLKSKHILFVDASELTGINLTFRHGEKIGN